MSLPAVTLSLSLFHCSTTGEPNDTPTKHQLPTDWTHVSQSHHITGVSFTQGLGRRRRRASLLRSTGPPVCVSVLSLAVMMRERGVCSGF